MMRDIPSYRSTYDQALTARSAAIARARANPDNKSSSTPRIHITGLSPSEAMAQSESRNPSSSSTTKNPDAASVRSTSTFSSTISLLKSSLHKDESKSERKQREKEDRKRRKEEEKKRWEDKHPDDGKTRE